VQLRKGVEAYHEGRAAGGKQGVDQRAAGVMASQAQAQARQGAWSLAEDWQLLRKLYTTGACLFPTRGSLSNLPPTHSIGMKARIGMKDWN
jgi:hypothetical protein